MSNNVLSQWQVFCTSNNRNEYVWSETEPTTCPFDPIGHTIDTTKTAIIQKIQNNVFTIQEELVSLTQGIYKFKGYKTAIPPGTPGDVTIINVSWPRPITLLNGDFDSNTNQIGDEINASIIPNTPIGAITATVTAGATVINVSPTVFTHCYNGFKVFLTDGVNMNDLGECMSKNPTAGTITVQTAAVRNFSPLGPTYVLIEAEVVSSLHVTTQKTYEFARKKIGGKTLSNVVFRIAYKNNSGLAKNFAYNFEYIY